MHRRWNILNITFMLAMEIIRRHFSLITQTQKQLLQLVVTILVQVREIHVCSQPS